LKLPPSKQGAYYLLGKKRKERLSPPLFKKKKRHYLKKKGSLSSRGKKKGPVFSFPRTKRNSLKKREIFSKQLSEGRSDRFYEKKGG